MAAGGTPGRRCVKPCFGRG